MEFKGIYLENINEKLDLNEIVKIIAFEDIKAYVFKKIDKSKLTMFEMDNYMIAESCQIAQILKSEGYKIINYYDEEYEHQKEIIALKKQNKLLQHNISVLQKKLNKLKQVIQCF